ncbi:exported hypothetical protein [Hyphomicrobiales bacterium]|nr:exported hypothetical protein [Hyphomicrobiales bacterium]
MRVYLLAALFAWIATPALAQSCDYCGCKGGPGYRDAKGKCVGWKQLSKACGNPPTTRCTYEKGDLEPEAEED